MTYQGAIDELKSLENNESMPDWFKPALKKVRETMEMDRREKLDDVKFRIEHMACRQYEHRLMLDRQEVLEILDNIGKAESEE